MSLCKKCKDKICLKTGISCPEVEKLLTQMTVGKLPHTIVLNSNYLDEVIVYDEDINKGKFKERETKKAD